jgi:hypothetical protein
MMRGFETMAQTKSTSKRGSKPGKTRAERLRQGAGALHEEHTQHAQSEERWRYVFEHSVIRVDPMRFREIVEIEAPKGFSGRQD